MCRKESGERRRATGCSTKSASYETQKHTEVLSTFSASQAMSVQQEMQQKSKKGIEHIYKIDEKLEVSIRTALPT